MGLESISLDRNPYSNYPESKFEQERSIEDLGNNIVTAGMGVVGYYFFENQENSSGARG